VVAGLRLALEEEDVGYAAFGEEVGERGAGDATADDDDLEAAALRHVRSLTIPRPGRGRVAIRMRSRAQALLIASRSRSGLDAIGATIPGCG